MVPIPFFDISKWMDFMDSKAEIKKVIPRTPLKLPLREVSPQNAIKSRDIFEEVGNEQGMERVGEGVLPQVEVFSPGESCWNIFRCMFFSLKKKFQLNSPQKLTCTLKKGPFQKNTFVFLSHYFWRGVRC